MSTRWTYHSPVPYEASGLRRAAEEGIVNDRPCTTHSLVPERVIVDWMDSTYAGTNGYASFPEERRLRWGAGHRAVSAHEKGVNRPLWATCGKRFSANRRMQKLKPVFWHVGVGFKIRFPHGSVGSSPTSGTSSRSKKTPRIGADRRFRGVWCWSRAVVLEPGGPLLSTSRAAWWRRCRGR